jgi:hypothetical protein
MSQQVMDELQIIIETYGFALQNTSYLTENAFWNEMVISILHRCRKLETSLNRDAADVLQYLELSDIRKLSKVHIAEQPNNSEDVVAITSVLKRHEFSNEEAQMAIKVLASIAHVLVQHYDGKIQVYIRAMGQVIIETLLAKLPPIPFNRQDTEYALGHWMQTAFGMPVSVPYPVIVRFCEQYNVTLEALTAVADELGLNTALLADLLAVADADGYFELTSSNVPPPTGG